MGVFIPRRAVFPLWCSRSCPLGAPGYCCETGTCQSNQAHVLAPSFMDKHPCTFFLPNGTSHTDAHSLSNWSWEPRQLNLGMQKYTNPLHAISELRHQLGTTSLVKMSRLVFLRFHIQGFTIIFKYYKMQYFCLLCLNLPV